MSDYYEQISLFDDVLTDFKFTKPVRLISFFSGIEAQYKALSFLGSKLGVQVESYKTCEWAYNSIIACNAIHNRDFTDYSEGKSKEELINAIRGISVDYNQPLTDEQLEKRPLSWIKKAYNACVANHNLINIMDVKGGDLGITETDKYEYILTYSFPCQDLSLAGRRAGMDTSQSEGGTRSGLLWEVERILNECKQLGSLPSVLIMENVVQVHSEKDMPNFRKWIQALEDLGYNNYWEDLNAKDYGIPQNRVRTFMVSILGHEYNYRFPIKFRRELNLKDMLEISVDEKYYLSKKMITYLTGVEQKESKYHRGEVFKRNFDPNKDVAATITTCAGQRPTDNFIVEEKYGREALNETIEGQELHEGEFIDAYNRNVIKDGTAGTLTTRTNDSNNYFVVDLKRGYPVEVKPESEKPVDGVEVIGNYSKSDFCQTPIVGKNGIAPTFTENHGQVTAIAIRENNSEGYKVAHEGDGINISSRMHHQRGNVQEGMAQTLKTTMEVGVIDPTLRIRKLTPKEAMRLMGFQDIDVQHMYEVGLTDASIFHSAGDSLVVPTMLGMLAKLYGQTPSQTENLIKEYIKTIW